MSERGAAEVIAVRLSAYLGPNTARVAVRTFAASALGLAPDEVTEKDAPRLLEALRPMLKTLLGASVTQEILDAVARELAIELLAPAQPIA